jgi:uncharacterized protein (TIGR02145 family)
MKKINPLLLIILAMVVLYADGCKRKIKPIFDEMTDARDNQTYQTVTLDDQTWLAQDLNYKTDNNSWCYDDDPANCEIYGRLYDWEAALTACPAGWHLGSDEEWSTLVKYLDRRSEPNDGFEISKIAGGMMKKTGTIEAGTGLWHSPNTGATNSSGFSALPSGNRNPAGAYKMLGYHIMFWTSTEYDDSHAWTMMLDMTQKGILRDYTGVTKDYGISVRCVMD